MPRYRAETEYDHGSLPKIGVLVANLGTPDAPTSSAVRRYLRQFLSDPRLIELPRWLWLMILNLVILVIRPSRSAKAYAKIWTDEGSPLLTISERLVEKLGRAIPEHNGQEVLVELGMSYGSPSLLSALDTLHASNISELVVLPLYPQYSATTTASVFDQIAVWLKRTRRIPSISLINAYHDRPDYIEALAKSIEDYWAKNERGDRLLLSFHGIPRRYLDSGDPYHCHCYKTARLLATRLKLSDADYTVSFQSRVGKEEWLRPYTDELLGEWGVSGTGVIDVICPGFSIDCLETLEEIALQNRELYLKAGGKDLRYIPSLNDSDAHVEMLSNLLRDRMLVLPMDSEAQRSASRELALSAGAKK